MKKEALILVLLIMLSVFFSHSVIGDDEGTVELDESASESERVDKAEDCLKDIVEERGCEDLSIEEKIFVLLSIGKCKSELADESNDEECWPKSSCNLKTTAQAILAMDNSGSSTKDAEKWLIKQNITAKDMIWYLQIESPNTATCSITYSGSDYEIVLKEDKLLSSGAGSCLSLSASGYWLRISESCYGEEFEISCDQQFLTNLLFKEKDSSTIHVLSETSSASAEGKTYEQVNSYCFSQGSNCDYEGTLWAALALESLDYDIKSYLPYLISKADSYDSLLPESFLYTITGYTDFRNELLLKQKSKYWDESGDKFYDTAIALFPFQYEEPSEKSTAIDWLFEIQDKNGCWNGNIRNTGFLLYSVWPKKSSSSSSSSGSGWIDCEDAGFFCLSSMDCAGEILSSYDCSGTYKCCDTDKTPLTCREQGGEVCNIDENCISGTEADAGDLDSGEICCVGGSCAIPAGTEESECEQYGGTCRLSCNENEEEISYECDFNDACCLEKIDKDSGNGLPWWIWLLIILIILLILGIIFRDKLRPYYYKMKSKFSKKKPGSGPGPPRNHMHMPPRRPFNRHILPPRNRPPMSRPPMGPPKSHPPTHSKTPLKNFKLKLKKPQPNAEVDDVLKKLKDMGK